MWMSATYLVEMRDLQDLQLPAESMWGTCRRLHQTEVHRAARRSSASQPRRADTNAGAEKTVAQRMLSAQAEVRFAAALPQMSVFGCRCS